MKKPIERVIVIILFGNGNILTITGTNNERVVDRIKNLKLDDYSGGSVELD